MKLLTLTLCVALALAAGQEGFCGNKVHDGGEICDPSVHIKGCSEDCQALAGWTCMDFSFLNPTWGHRCMYRCGDGVVAVGAEVCDGQPGCASNCAPETGMSCEGFPDGTGECITLEERSARDAAPAEDAPTTGEEGAQIDAIANEAEPLENASRASVEGTVNTGAGCGNGVADDGEECDDGNDVDGDGCTSTCEVECGFECVGDHCGPICGDGIKAGTETCDSVEGCSDTCTALPDFECEVDENKCAHVCGNGIKDEGEICDGGHNLLEHFPAPWCTKECDRAPHWKCFADPSKPCVKDCPNDALAKVYGREYWVI